MFPIKVIDRILLLSYGCTLASCLTTTATEPSHEPIVSISSQMIVRNEEKKRESIIFKKRNDF